MGSEEARSGLHLQRVVALRFCAQAPDSGAAGSQLTASPTELTWAAAFASLGLISSSVEVPSPRVEVRIL